MSHFHEGVLCTDKDCEMRHQVHGMHVEGTADAAKAAAAVGARYQHRTAPTQLHDCREDLRPRHPIARRSVNRAVKAVENVIFNIRWMLIPFYAGLAGVLAVYGWVSIKGIVSFFASINTASIDDAKLFAFDTIDIVMIANLIKMIAPGSYNSYVSKQHGYTNENISSGELKTKIATSVVILSMVHLLKSLVSTDVTWENIERQLILFGAFLIGALILSVIEYIHIRSEQHEVGK